MKIEYQRTSEKIYRIVAVTNIPVGTVFSGKHSGRGYEEDIYLRTYNGVVSLSNPELTWTIGQELPAEYSTLSYLNYTPLDVTLVIKGELHNAE